VKKNLGKRVRALRLAHGWSQEELGERCALDRTYVSGVERGVRNPTVSVLTALAGGLGVRLTDLFEEGKV
jgi:transcriptional regulator with XRE-family HTH domain